MVPPLDRNWMIGSWRIPEHQIPVIVGVSLGVLFLLLAIALLIIWRCCRLNRLREKAQYREHSTFNRLHVLSSSENAYCYSDGQQWRRRKNAGAELGFQ